MVSLLYNLDAVMVSLLCSRDAGNIFGRRHMGSILVPDRDRKNIVASYSLFVIHRQVAPPFWRLGWNH